MAEPGPASSPQTDDDRSTWPEVEDATQSGAVALPPIGMKGPCGPHPRLDADGLLAPCAGAIGAAPVAACPALGLTRAGGATCRATATAR